MSFPEMTWECVSERRRGRGKTCVVCGSLDGVTNFGIEAIADVDDGGGLLEDAKGFDQWGRKPLCGTADIKVLEGAVTWMSGGEKERGTHTVASGHPSSGLQGPGGRQKCRVPACMTWGT